MAGRRYVQGLFPWSPSCYYATPGGHWQELTHTSILQLDAEPARQRMLRLPRLLDVLVEHTCAVGFANLQLSMKPPRNRRVTAVWRCGLTEPRLHGCDTAVTNAA